MATRHMLVALGVVFAVAASSLVLSACGSSSSSQEQLNQARRQGAAQARQQIKIQQIQNQLKALKKGQASGATTTTSGSSSGGPTSCGGDLSVGSGTTCGFAQNVEDGYRSNIGSGSGAVYAFSPTTGKTYAMYCSAGTPHICAGGNNASVYFP